MCAVCFVFVVCGLSAVVAVLESVTYDVFMYVLLLWCSTDVYLFFFFKQKTAYEMRISDWSSDVCSSDLRSGGGTGEHARQAQRLETLVPVSRVPIMTAPVEILIHVTGLAAARVCAKHALKPRGMSRQGRSARALSGRMPPACADGPAPRPWRARASGLRSACRTGWAGSRGPSGAARRNRAAAQAS